MSFALAFCVTNCARLLLNIRRAYYVGNDSVQLTHLSSFAADSESALEEHVSYGRHPRSRGSLELDQYGEIEVAVCVEVTRTCEDVGPDIWEYEMTEMSSGIH